MTKTRSAAKHPAAARRGPGKRLPVALVLGAWWLAQLACAGGFTPPNMPLPPTITPVQIVSANEPIPTATPEFQPAIGGGSADPLPTLPVEPPPTSPPEPLPQTTVEAAPNPTQTPAQPAANVQARETPILYYTQAGDTLKALAVRFNVDPSEITSPERIQPEGLFDPGILLLIPPRLGEVSSSKQLIPDSEVVYSPSALDIDLNTFVAEANGYLYINYREWHTNGWHSGAQVVQRVAIENSINPRLLLAVLEKQSHWVYGVPQSLAETDYPIGWMNLENGKKSLYYQLSWAVQQLNIGYYGWRDGTVTELTFPNGATLRLAPDLNAGTVSVLYLFSKLYNQQEWAGVLYGPDGLMVLYERMFGNPWARAQSVEPLFPATLTQPPLELPFSPGRTWSLTGGPHSAWGPNGARAALDFAPSTTVHGCYDSDDWVTAASSGLVVRSENGVVVLDLDSDGYEQTGWAILYLHISSKDRVPLGTWVNLNDLIGHPSCEGGVSNGTHVHIARKYNGEWILADGPMPFALSGWRAHAGKELYMGTLTRGDETVYASQVGSWESRVTRPKSGQ